MTFENSVPVPPASVPPPVVGSSDKVLVILCHLSWILGVGFLLPLIVYLVKKNDPDTVAAHAKEALNFHLSLLLYGLCCLPLMIIYIGIPLVLLLALFGFVFAIVAAFKAADHILYRYPLTIRFIG